MVWILRAPLGEEPIGLRVLVQLWFRHLALAQLLHRLRDRCQWAWLFSLRHGFGL